MVYIIDMNQIRKALPERADVLLKKQVRDWHAPTIEIRVNNPSLTEKEFEDAKKQHRTILGAAPDSFYTEETGHHWRIYLKREPMEFINLTDDDVNSFSDMHLVTDGSLIQSTPDRRRDNQ